jgi:hypothetical protein
MDHLFVRALYRAATGALLQSHRNFFDSSAVRSNAERRV